MNTKERFIFFVLFLFWFQPLFVVSQTESGTSWEYCVAKQAENGIKHTSLSEQRWQSYHAGSKITAGFSKPSFWFRTKLPDRNSKYNLVIAPFGVKYPFEIYVGKHRVYTNFDTINSRNNRFKPLKWYSVNLSGSGDYVYLRLFVKKPEAIKIDSLPDILPGRSVFKKVLNTTVLNSLLLSFAAGVALLLIFILYRHKKNIPAHRFLLFSLSVVFFLLVRGLLPYSSLQHFALRWYLVISSWVFPAFFLFLYKEGHQPMRSIQKKFFRYAKWLILLAGVVLISCDLAHLIHWFERGQIIFHALLLMLLFVAFLFDIDISSRQKAHIPHTLATLCFMPVFGFDLYLHHHLLSAYPDISFFGAFLGFLFILAGQFHTLKKEIVNTTATVDETINEKELLEQKNNELSEKNRSLLTLLDERTEKLNATNKALGELNAELVESETLSRQVANCLLETIIIHSNDKILDINGEFENLTAYGEREILGKSFLHFIAESHIKTVKNNLEKQYDKPYEIKIRRKDGAEVFCEVLTKPLYFQGEPSYVTAIRNIDQRKQAEEALQKSQNRLSAIFANATVGIGIISQNGDFEQFNAHLAEMFGYTKNEFEGQNYFNLLYRQRENNQHNDKRNVSFSGEKEFVKQHQFTKKSGSVFWGLVSAANLNQNRTKTDSYVCIIIDVTDQKNIEHKLQRAEKRFRSLYENAPIGIFQSSFNDKFISVNPEFANITGYSSPDKLYDELKDIKTHLFFNADDYTVLKHRITRSGSINNFETRLRKKDKSVIWIALNARLEKDKAGNFIIDGYIYNITERKEAEKELRSNREQLSIIMDGVPASIAYIDDALNILHVNRAFSSFYGYYPGELIGKKLSEVLNKSNFENNQQYYNKALKGEDVSFENSVTNDKSHTHIVNIQLVPHKSNNGKVNAFFLLMQDITEEKKAEQALRQSEERYRNLIETMNEGLCMVDLNRKITYANPSLCQMTGYKQDEILNQPFDKFLNNKKRMRILQKNKKKGSSPFVPYELELIRKNGKVLFTIVAPRPMYDKNNTLCGYFAVITNVSAIKNAEKALEREKNLLRTLIDNIPDLIYVKDDKGKYVIVNKSFVEMMGKKHQDEIIGQTVDDLLPAKTANLVKMLEKQIKKSGKPIFSYEMLYKIPSGKQFWSLKTTVPLYDKKSNKISGFVGINRDVTPLKQTEYKLSQTLKELEGVIETIPDLFFVYDENGKLIKWNKRFEEFTDRPADKMEGCLPTDFFSGEDKKKVEKAVKKLVATGQLIAFEAKMDSKNMIKREMEFNAARITDENDNLIGYVGIGRDITERKRAAQELIKAKEEAENANKAKSIFLANMSHEIRTPMNAVMGFADILNANVQDKKLKNYIQSIKTGGKTLLDLINDILDLSKIEAGQMPISFHTIDFYEILDEVRQTYAYEADKKQLDFILEIHPDTPKSIITDRKRCKQILFNVVGNAVKFTKHGFVKLNVSANKQNVKRHQTTGGNIFDIIITVEDTGIGIPEKAQGLVFESFKQHEHFSRKKYGGTGLGLSITKKLLDLMGGTISLKSQINKGSIFTIVLKNITGYDKISTGKRKVRKIDYENIEFIESSILVVDDVESNRILISAYFDNTKVNVLTAQGGKEALEEIQKKPQPNVVLLDIKMPEIDGFETLKRIRLQKHLADIPVFAITGSNMKTDIDKIKQAGFDGYLQKPIQRKKLINTLAPYLTTAVNEKKEEDDITKIERKPIISDKQCKLLPEVIAFFEDELYPVFRKVKTNQRMEDMKMLARKIEETGMKYDIKMLTDYGKNMQFYAESFDIENLLLMVNKFPDLITSLKSKL